MNRQLRRATEKSDKKRDKERDKRRGARKTPSQRSAKSSQGRASSSDKVKSPEKTGAKASRQQRWAGVQVLLAAVVIVLQAIFPGEVDTFTLVIYGLFYLTFGYFLTTWLFRRQIMQAPFIALVIGALLASGVEAVKFFRPEVTADPILVYVALPGLLLGALLGRFVYMRNG